MLICWCSQWVSEWMLLFPDSLKISCCAVHKALWPQYLNRIDETKQKKGKTHPAMQNNFNDTAEILLHRLAYIRLPHQMLLYFGCFLRFSSHLSSCSRIHLNFGKTFPLTPVVVVVHHFFSVKTTTHPFEKVQPTLPISVHLRSFLAHNLQQTNL